MLAAGRDKQISDEKLVAMTEERDTVSPAPASSPFHTRPRLVIHLSRQPPSTPFQAVSQLEVAHESAAVNCRERETLIVAQDALVASLQTDHRAQTVALLLEIKQVCSPPPLPPFLASRFADDLSLSPRFAEQGLQRRTQRLH